MSQRFTAALCAGAAGVAIGACQDTSPNEPPVPTVSVTTAQPPANEPTPTGSDSTSAPPAGESTQQWKMPNLVGTTLQQAQDAIQGLTGGAIFVSTSHDATGKGRNQVLDSNWKVCSQNIPAGTSINARTRIDFGAVKLSEACP